MKAFLGLLVVVIIFVGAFFIGNWFMPEETIQGKIISSLFGILIEVGIVLLLILSGLIIHAVVEFLEDYNL